MLCRGQSQVLLLSLICQYADALLKTFFIKILSFTTFNLVLGELLSSPTGYLKDNNGNQMGFFGLVKFFT